MKKLITILLFTASSFNLALAKEIALTFDDAPVSTSTFFESYTRTQELIKKLKQANVPSVMIFTNPCKGQNKKKTLEQLKSYQSAGNIIGNHTCSHLRLDDVGYQKFISDAEAADERLKGLIPEKKFFRFPYLNEGSTEGLRNQVRAWDAGLESELEKILNLAKK